MWQPAARRHSGDPAGAPVTNLVLLPPTIGRGVDGAPATDDPAPPAEPGAAPRYLLATPVPGNWVPLLPVQLDDHGTLVTRLKRGGVLQPDGTNRVRHGRSQVLAALAVSALYDEEVPREGAHLTER
jgi:hypothetical protein